MKLSRGITSPWVIAIAASAAVMTAATACGSDSSDSASTTSSAALPSDAFPGKAATGAPVRIGLINNEGGQAISQPENREAAEAATKYANENLGGIAGRPIELVVCKEQEDPVSARNCANQMVEQKVSAVVVTSTGLGNIMAPIITAAGIPYATALAGSQAETSSDNAYVWTAGSSTSQVMANYAKKEGMKSVVAYSIDSPAATGSLEMIGAPAFKAAGIDFKVIPIPYGSPDATPQVSSGLDANPDGVIVYGESTVCTSVLKSLKTLGSSATIMTPQACAAQDVVDGVGAGNLEGLKVFSNADTTSDDPESALFRAVMQKYAPNTSTAGYAVAGYQGVLGLVRATSGLTGEVNPASVGGAIQQAQRVVLPAGDGITFTCDGNQVPGMKSVCGNELIVLTMKDGKLTDPSTVALSA
ncbi:ABC transporter substrate-binding protein [Gordonia insulae]|uniref:Leucine-binding protein domain-containing protein n=1 Tax=Gordonia insulae TaxID=2420509 RepID=A0A3G8JLB0_9ACTN|nr:ABC transporter substrate-binding protein [Gordonia insulae]AZG45871.1 hypothetical protein D7316_02471 [Gordonia insulae]